MQCHLLPNSHERWPDSLFRWEKGSPFSTLVLSLPCLAFSNTGMWAEPVTSANSLHDLSKSAPSPQGAVLKEIQRHCVIMLQAFTVRKCDPLSLNKKGHAPDCRCLLAVVPVLMHTIPDVQMERDIIFDLEQTILCNLKYVVFCRTIPMLHQLTVQKAMSRERMG